MESVALKTFTAPATEIPIPTHESFPLRSVKDTDEALEPTHSRPLLAAVHTTNVPDVPLMTIFAVDNDPPQLITVEPELNVAVLMVVLTLLIVRRDVALEKRNISLTDESVVPMAVTDV